MLDLVPFAGSRRQMTDGDGEAEFVGQTLQFSLPQPNPCAVAATAIGGDQQAACVGVSLASHGLPPASDGMNREACRVVIDAHADPTGVAGDVIHLGRVARLLTRCLL